MKFICLGYFNQEVLDTMSLEDVNKFIGECLAYGAALSQSGHVVAGELLQSPDFAKSVQNIDGKIKITDGPLVKSETVLIPIITLEAESIEHAAELMAKHPALAKSGSFEIRRVEDINEMKEGISGG